MSELMEQMETLRRERIERLANLYKNTIAMRLVTVKARAAGLSSYRIAKLLGVTYRTVCLWLKS